MKKTSLNLFPENEEAIKAIRKENPYLESDAAVIRYALSNTALMAGIDYKQTPDQEALGKKVSKMADAQSVTNILLLSVMDIMKIPTITTPDPLKSDRMLVAERTLKKHINAAQRDIRHGGARDGNSSPHDQA